MTERNFFIARWWRVAKSVVGMRGKGVKCWERCRVSCVLLVAGFTGVTELSAGDAGKSPVTFSEDRFTFEGYHRNRVRIGYRMGTNVSVGFKDLESISLHRRSTASGYRSGRSGEYQDGYVRTDSSGNAGGLTWNWGYSNSSQIKGDSLQLSRQSAMGSSSTHHWVTVPRQEHSFDADNFHGVELIYARELVRRDRFSFGVEAGFSYSRIDTSSHRSARFTAKGDSVTKKGARTVQVDSYALGGVSPPPGHQGTFAGPGPLIPAAPASTSFNVHRSTSQRSGYEASGELSGRSYFDSDLYMFRLGPWVEYDLTPQVHFGLGAGVLLTIADSSYGYAESLSVHGFGERGYRADGDQVDALFGGYLDSRLVVDLNERLSLYTTAQLNFSEGIEETVGRKEVDVDLGAAFYWGVGVQFRF